MSATASRRSNVASPLPARYADFGTAIASVDVDDWVLSTIKTWLPTYLAHVESAKGLDYSIGVPTSYANVIQDDEWPDHSLPAILVATVKTDGTPQIRPDGGYTVGWLAAVSAVVRGQNAAMTRELASYTELAVRMALVQHQTLGGNARATRWVNGGQARPVSDPTGKGRFLGEGASSFEIWTDGTVFQDRGPTEPEPDYGPLPLVDRIQVGVDDELVDVVVDPTDQTEGSMPARKE